MRRWSGRGGGNIKNAPRAEISNKARLIFREVYRPHPGAMVEPRISNLALTTLWRVLDLPRRSGDNQIARRQSAAGDKLESLVERARLLDRRAVRNVGWAIIPPAVHTRRGQFVCCSVSSALPMPACNIWPMTRDRWQRSYALERAIRLARDHPQRFCLKGNMPLAPLLAGDLYPQPCSMRTMRCCAFRAIVFPHMVKVLALQIGMAALMRWARAKRAL